MASILTSLSKYEHFNIFSYLEVKDLTSFLYVNKKERNFVLDFFRENKSLKIKKNDVSRLRRVYTIKNLFKTFPKLIVLKINAFNFSAESFEHIPKTLTYLHLLNCKESLLLKTDLYINLQERLGHSLKELHIEYFSELDVLDNNESEDLSIALEKFAKEMIVLEVLTVWAICQGEQTYTMHGINNKFFYAFYSHSLSLTSVNFNNLVIWQNLRLSKSKIRNLKVKTTEGFLLDNRDDHQIFGLNDQTISFLTYYFEQIENLAICDYLMSQRKNLSDNTLTNFVMKFPGLKTLYLNSYSYKFHLNEMTILQTVSSLNSLISFGIASCKNFQLGNIVSVTPNLSNISNLNLDFTEIDDYSLHLATSLFKHLKSISLKCCRKISEDGFGFLTQNLPNLEGCNFKYNFNFGSTALKNLVLNSKKLKKIKLGNNFLSNTDITTIFQQTSNLKELAFCAMNDSDNFSQDCFYELTSSNLLNSDLLWKLKSLDLSNNSFIDDTSILHLTKLGLRNLAFLSLAGCSQMTQDCFEYIALSSFAERLYDLNLCIETLYIDLELFEDYRPKFKRLACVYLFRSANAKTLEDKFFDINFVLK